MPKRNKLDEVTLDYVLDEIAAMPLSQKTQEDVRDDLEETFGVSISRERVSQIGTERHDEILRRREILRRDVVLTTPIADKIYRLKELQKQYKNAIDGRTAIMALREARNEIGEDFDKLAKALAASNSGHNIFNYVVSVDDPAKLDRLIREGNAALGNGDDAGGTSGKTDRFKLA